MGAAPPASRADRAARLASRPRVNALAGYILAAVCIAIATLIRFGIGWLDGEVLPLVSYYPGILLAALVGGGGPGLCHAPEPGGGVVGLSCSDIVIRAARTRGKHQPFRLYLHLCCRFGWWKAIASFGVMRRFPHARMGNADTGCSRLRTADDLRAACDRHHLGPDHLVIGYLCRR